MKAVKIGSAQIPYDATNGLRAGTWPATITVQELGGYVVVKLDVGGAYPAILHLTAQERAGLVGALIDDGA